MNNENLYGFEEKTEDLNGENTASIVQSEPCFLDTLDFNKTNEEKKEVKRAALAIGLAFLFLMLISKLSNEIAAFLFLGAGKNTEQAYRLLNDPAVSQIRQILFSVIVFSIPFIVVFKLFRYRISDLVSFKMPEKGIKLPLFLMGVGFCAFSNILSNLSSYLFDDIGVEYSVNFGEEPQGIYGFILTVLATAAVPALMEEFACRGIMLGALKKYGEGFALVTSAVMFGIMHGNFEQMPFAFLVGLVLGFVAIKSDSLLIVMAIHAFNNFIPIVYTHILNGTSAVFQNASYCIFLIACMLLGLFGVILFTKRGYGIACDNGNLKASFKQKEIWFFTSVPILVYVIITIAGSFRFFVN